MMMGLAFWLAQADSDAARIIDVIWKGVGILGILGGGIAIGRFGRTVDALGEKLEDMKKVVEQVSKDLKTMVEKESQALRAEINTNTDMLDTFAVDMRANIKDNSDRLLAIETAREVEQRLATERNALEQFGRRKYDRPTTDGPEERE